jgi:glucose-1-phosphate thymidylyltransferase
LKGILLAGGNGTRLGPLTKSTNKHLLPVYDKPMIYYSLTTLMFTGVREIALVCNPSSLPEMKTLLGDGSDWGLNFHYVTQDSPKGIAECFRLVPESFRRENVVVMLGDNLLYGSGLGESLKDTYKGSGAKIFAYFVKNPEEYGVLVIDDAGNAQKIVEKPKSSVSSLAIPGLYFFDNSVYDLSKHQVPSDRGELEITDILQTFLQGSNLEFDILERGIAWLDTGNPNSLLAASEFVEVIESRQGLKIGCPEEVAFRLGYITLEKVFELASRMPKSDYRSYLESF